MQGAAASVVAVAEGRRAQPLVWVLWPRGVGLIKGAYVGVVLLPGDAQ